MMNANNKILHEHGVSLWLDNITRKILNDGTLEKYISELSVAGLTTNPSIFDNAIANSDDYDMDIRSAAKTSGNEDIFFILAIDDIQRAADLFRPVYENTNRVDGFVSIEVSPLLAYDTESTIRAANVIFAREIANSEDPEAMRAEKIEEYREKFANPYVAASHGMIDDVIDPRETRIKLIQALEMMRNKKESRPKKKHGNIPL